MAINETIMQMSVESLPFGGVGESGMGAYHGKVKAAYSESLSFYRGLTKKLDVKLFPAKFKTILGWFFGHSKVSSRILTVNLFLP